MCPLKYSRNCGSPITPRRTRRRKLRRPGKDWGFPCESKFGLGDEYACRTECRCRGANVEHLKLVLTAGGPRCSTSRRPTQPQSCCAVAPPGTQPCTGGWK